jgi:hypothetical protein
MLTNEELESLYQKEFGDTELKIIAPYSLEKYEKIVEWDIS